MQTRLGFHYVTIRLKFAEMQPDKCYSFYYFYQVENKVKIQRIPYEGVCSDQDINI